MKRTLTMLVSSALCAAVISSCSKTETKTTANVLMVHASPSVPVTKITTDEAAPYSGNLAYGMNTGYVRLESGNRNIKMLLQDTAMLTTAIPLEADRYYSVFLIDTGSSISTLVLNDNLDKPAGNQSRLRFIHLSPNGVPVDVLITRTDDTVFKNKKFKEVTDFTTFNPGVYRMHIRRSGTVDTMIHIPTFTLSAGKIYTLFLKGLDSTTGKTAASSTLIQHN
jgi:hypothetical protein